MDDKLSVEDNIKNTYLNPISFLYEEPTNLLKQEVREPAIYTAIITAIATGSSRMSEISSKVGEDTNVCTNYIKNLMNLGIVQKETPYGEKVSRKSIYSIEDNMFRFWYRFVLDNNSIIARGAAEDYDKAKHLLMSHSKNRTVFDGLALAENAEELANLGVDSETPTLQQLSIGLLKYAEETR